MTEHTPGPWHTDSGVIMSEHGSGVALACGPGQIFGPRREVSEKRRKANAAYIVKACNAYPDLLDALRSAFDSWFKNPSNILKIEPEWVVMARAAIEKAEGGRRTGRRHHGPPTADPTRIP